MTLCLTLLSYLFEFQVKVLESKDRIGGRIWDDNRSGVCFAQGAQLMAGAVNNPMAILAYQVSSVLWVVHSLPRWAHCYGSFIHYPGELTAVGRSCIHSWHYPGELTAVGHSLPR